MRQQNYTFEALESWFVDYNPRWFHQDTAVLELARQWHEENKIRTLQVHDNHLAIVTQYESSPLYVTVEKNERELSVRGANNDLAWGRAIALAGVYALEEIFEKNINWLGTGLHASVQTRIRPIESLQMSPSKGNIQRLRIIFRPAREGLQFEVGGMDSLSTVPREDFLRLLKLAHDAGFKRRNNYFECTQLDAVAEFAKFHLARWRELFDLEIPDNLSSLWLGAKNVDIQLVERPGLTFRYRLHVDGEEVSFSGIKGGGTQDRMFWSERHGLVKLSDQSANVLKIIDHYGFHTGGDLPRYLIFPLSHQQKMIELSEALKRNLEEFKNPPQACEEGMPNFLRPYQKYGVGWMLHLFKYGFHPLLADEMGLGKTLQVLAVTRKLPETDKHDLLICPASVVGTWMEQTRTFFPDIKVHILNAGEDVSKVPPTLFLSTYTQMRHFVQTNPHMGFRLVILDEAQCIKNPNAQTTIACCRLNAQYRIAITGTPIENRLLDLWTLFRFLMPGMFGSRRGFVRWMMEENAPEKFAIQVAPFILRRTKEMVSRELPAKIATTVTCQMTDHQRKLYVDRRALKSQLKVGEWSHLFTLLLRLRQICCDVGLLPGNETADVLASAKAQWLRLKLEECFAQNRKVVVFSQFKRWLERLYPMVRSIYPNTLKLFGDTKNRHRLIENFQCLDRPAAFLISLKAGGTGITLHAANTVFLLDPWWNPAVEEQAIDRLHRVGQKDTVWIYRVLAHNSIEERIQQLQSAKHELLDTILNTSPQTWMDKWNTLTQLLEGGDESTAKRPES